MRAGGRTSTADQLTATGPERSWASNLGEPVRCEIGPNRHTHFEEVSRVTHRYKDFAALEGRSVLVALADGSSIDDCELVSAGHGRASTLWLFARESDVFVARADVVDIQPATPAVELACLR
jgi:hypothetical protein